MLNTFLQALSLQWVLIQLFAILCCGLDGGNVRPLFELEMWLSRGLSSTPVFTQPIMQKSFSHLRNFCDCSSWKVSQNLALTNNSCSTWSVCLSLLSLLLQQRRFSFVLGVSSATEGESHEDLFVIFCIAAWSRKHLLSAAVFCYQLVSVISTGLHGIAIIPQQGVLLKCQGSVLARYCCNLPIHLLL